MLCVLQVADNFVSPLLDAVLLDSLLGYPWAVLSLEQGLTMLCVLQVADNFVSPLLDAVLLDSLLGFPWAVLSLELFCWTVYWATRGQCLALSKD